jgi:tRNA (cmo5U34)-methyltransferase
MVMDDEAFDIEFSIDDLKPKGRGKRSAAPVEKFTFVMDGGKQAEPIKENKTFSFTNYAEEFDEHINQSIRGYSNLRDDIVSISRYFVEDDTTVIDIGCSQGSLICRIRDANTQAPNATYYGVDVNKAFKQHWKNERNLKYLIEDVRTWNGMTNLSLAISLFTFQFIPERDRLALMKKIYDNLVEGGAFVFSEKVFSMNSKIQNMMEFIYYDHKKKSFTEKEILDKEQELRHLAKLTNEDLLIKQLLSIGFRGIQVFWRNHNFIGVIAMKLPKNNWDDKNG